MRFNKNEFYFNINSNFVKKILRFKQFLRILRKETMGLHLLIIKFFVSTRNNICTILCGIFLHCKFLILLLF